MDINHETGEVYPAGFWNYERERLVVEVMAAYPTETEENMRCAVDEMMGECPPPVPPAGWVVPALVA